MIVKDNNKVFNMTCKIKSSDPICAVCLQTGDDMERSGKDLALQGFFGHIHKKASHLLCKECHTSVQQSALKDRCLGCNSIPEGCTAQNWTKPFVITTLKNKSLLIEEKRALPALPESFYNAPDFLALREQCGEWNDYTKGSSSGISRFL